jgi:ataxia telangiectasia mutated family protein
VFAERQYQDIKKSSDTARYIAYVEISMKQALARKAEVKHTQQGSSSYSAAVNLQRKAEKALKEDRNRLEQHTRTLRSFREQAVEMFSRCMSVSDDFDEESIMRFISLWFDNFGEAALYSNLRPAVDRVASRKFVFLAHQLSARLSSDESTAPPTQVPSTQQSDIAQSREGQSILKSLVLRMCREHPFHSVYQVYCIQPEVDRAASHSRRQSGRVEAPSSQLSRETAATEIFSILHEDKDSRHRVMAVERLCNASLQWAKHPIKKELSEKRKKGPLSVPDTLLIRKIHDIRAPVSTARTPLDPTMRYDDCVWVVRYDSTFQTAGGVNLPKISTCLGSDGTSYKQLVSRVYFPAVHPG